MFQPLFLTQPSFGFSCTSHVLFILFTLPGRHHPCIWWANVFKPLISQAFLFLVTPCWMPLSAFLFPLRRHLSLSLSLSVRPIGFSPMNICELSLDLLVESKPHGLRPYDSDLHITHVPSTVPDILEVDKGFDWIR